MNTTYKVRYKGGGTIEQEWSGWNSLRGDIETEVTMIKRARYVKIGNEDFIQGEQELHKVAEMKMWLVCSSHRMLATKAGGGVLSQGELVGAEIKPHTSMDVLSGVAQKFDFFFFFFFFFEMGIHCRERNIKFALL